MMDRRNARTISVMAVVAVAVALAGIAQPARGGAEPGVVRFAALGDIAATVHSDGVLRAIDASGPDLAIALGDLSYGATGAEQAWCDFVTSRLGAGFPFELVSGNHESSGQNGNINDFSACLPNQLPGLVGTYGRQWYVDVPQTAPLVRFVAISPALPFVDGTWSYAAGTARYAWTAAAIDDARAVGIPWVVVSMHKPCLSVGTYACEPGADLVNMLLSKRVDLVLSGHEHAYMRTNQIALGTGCTALTPGTYTEQCVADADNAFQKGRGTVFAVVGTGGTPLRDVNGEDSEAPYFAAVSGRNANPTYGSLSVRLAPDALEASFLRGSGGTFADAFAITVGENASPTASFISTSNGLQGSFDGTGSSDPDGTVRTWAWDFGDGSSGAGATVSHAYAAAGDYDVRLTVTDDRGATAVTSQSVTVTAPPAQPPAFAEDSFGRTVTNGWGTADLGGAWSLVGTYPRFFVTPGAAGMTLAVAPAQLSAALPAAPSTDTDLRLTLSSDKPATGGGLYLTVAGRRINATTEYSARVRLLATGKMMLSIVTMRGTASVVMLTPEIALPGTYVAGERIAVRLQVVGTSPTTVRVKMWPVTEAEPTGWQQTATDATAVLQAAGGPGVTAYLSSTATNAPFVVRVGDLSARPTAPVGASRASDAAPARR